MAKKNDSKYFNKGIAGSAQMADTGAQLGKRFYCFKYKLYV
jgi:hypothetical protein